MNGLELWVAVDEPREELKLMMSMAAAGASGRRNLSYGREQRKEVTGKRNLLPCKINGFGNMQHILFIVSQVRIYIDLLLSSKTISHNKRKGSI